MYKIFICDIQITRRVYDTHTPTKLYIRIYGVTKNKMVIQSKHVIIRAYGKESSAKHILLQEKFSEAYIIRGYRKKRKKDQQSGYSFYKGNKM